MYLRLRVRVVVVSNVDIISTALQYRFIDEDSRRGLAKFYSLLRVCRYVLF